MLSPTPDTQVLLLLLSRLAQPRADVSPIALNDYNVLASWLHKRGMRPGDLLSAEGRQHLREGPPVLDRRRIEALLGRGAALALAMESWLSRGLWVIGRGDPNYPQRLKQKLRHNAPPLLFGAGATALLERGGLAIVGSRAADDDALAFTKLLGKRCADADLTVISGGARGVDREAMTAALASGGRVIGILPGDLERTAVDKAFRRALEEQRLSLVSPYDPPVRFTVWAAMDRNKVVYALSDFGFVVSADFDKGGTWAGAVETLKADWVPLFVRMGAAGAPEGNRRLVERGAIPVEAGEMESATDWATTLREKAKAHSSRERPVRDQADLPL